MNWLTFEVRFIMKGNTIPKFDDNDLCELSDELQQTFYNFLLDRKNEENVDVTATIEEVKDVR